MNVDWTSEPVIRLISFLSVLLLMSVWETVSPRRVRTVGRTARALNNLGLAVVNTVVLRSLPALSAVAAAEWAEARDLGLMRMTELPVVFRSLLTLLAMDLLVYGQHVAAHRVPIFWRFHKVHHSDVDLDATSGLRFHTVEIVASMVLKSVAAVLLGARPFDIMLFEVLLNSTSVFNHSNARLLPQVDRLLRWLVVTPDMHRVHHSVEHDEQNSNFGFNLPWWDRLFQTYRSQPRADHAAMALGIQEVSDPGKVVTILQMLRLPFVGRSAATNAVLGKQAAEPAADRSTAAE